MLGPQPARPLRGDREGPVAVRILAAALLLLAAAPPARAGVQLQVGGSVEPAPDGFMVRVDVANQGDAAATRLDVEGELFGHHAEGGLAAGVRAGATESLWLHFPVTPPRPGVHAVALHLRYATSAGGEPASQRAYLLLALGASAPAAVRLAATPALMETAGTLDVAVESADGRAHDLHLRLLTPRGVNALEEPRLQVPATGAAVARVPLIRTGASRRDRLGVVVLAATEVDGAQSTAAVTTLVELVPHRPVMPRLRPFLVGAGVLLLLAGIALELRGRRG